MTEGLFLNLPDLPGCCATPGSAAHQLMQPSGQTQPCCELMGSALCAFPAQTSCVSCSAAAGLSCREASPHQGSPGAWAVLVTPQSTTGALQTWVLAGELRGPSALSQQLCQEGLGAEPPTPSWKSTARRHMVLLLPKHRNSTGRSSQAGTFKWWHFDQVMQILL